VRGIDRARGELDEVRMLARLGGMSVLPSKRANASLCDTRAAILELMSTGMCASARASTDAQAFTKR
jgi:hypothetical protein